MFYQMEGKLSALNFKARRKMSTLWKYCDFEHENFFVPTGPPLKIRQNELRSKMRCVLRLTY